eukprot:4624112-Prorocentrum_lima.AAC.1
MTSSLVGSEMCIRDRRCGSCSEHKFKFSGCVQSMVRISLAPPFIAGLRICLLYTSDAADDM